MRDETFIKRLAMDGFHLVAVAFMPWLGAEAGDHIFWAVNLGPTGGSILRLQDERTLKGPSFWDEILCRILARDGFHLGVVAFMPRSGAKESQHSWLTINRANRRQCNTIHPNYK